MNVFDRFVTKYGRLPTEYDPDYLEMLQMSKYRILAVPDLKPGKCANCGSAKQDRNYVDFGLLVDWYGVVYLCSHCIADIARESGVFEELRTQMLKLVNKNEMKTSLQAQGEALHETVVRTFKEFEEFYVNLHSLRDDIPADSGAVVVNDKDPSNGSDSGRSESGTAESTSGSGRSNLRSLAELLNDPS